MVTAKVSGWMENRNGCPDISSITIWESQYELDMGAEQRVYADFSNKKGNILRGGFAVNLEGFIELCIKFLESHGYKIEKIQIKEMNNG